MICSFVFLQKNHTLSRTPGWILRIITLNRTLEMFFSKTRLRFRGMGDVTAFLQISYAASVKSAMVNIPNMFPYVNLWIKAVFFLNWRLMYYELSLYTKNPKIEISSGRHAVAYVPPVAVRGEVAAGGGRDSPPWLGLQLHPLQAR